MPGSEETNGGIRCDVPRLFFSQQIHVHMFKTHYSILPEMPVETAKQEKPTEAVFSLLERSLTPLAY